MFRLEPTRACAPSEQLRAKMELLSVATDEAFERVLQRCHEPQVFPSVLVLLHQIMRASVPLMKRAYDRARHGSPILADYLRCHIEEEADHDEWLRADISSACPQVLPLLDRPSPPAVAAVVGAQYYWIEHCDPVAVLGYIAVLEGFPPQDALLDDIKRRSGLPETAFRTCRKHGELDLDHRKDLDRLLDRLDLTETRYELVGCSASHTILGLARCYVALCEEPTT